MKWMTILLDIVLHSREVALLSGRLLHFSGVPTVE